MTLPFRAFLALVRQDLARFVSSGGLWLALSFFVLTILMAPFAIGPVPDLLVRVGPGIGWIAALLAMLMTLDRLFQIDLESGLMDVIAKSALGLELAIPAKLLAHWMATGLPIVLLSPVAGLLYGLPAAAIGDLALTLAVGTPGLTAAGGLAASLTAGMRRGGLLLALLVLPLAVPFVIFGGGAALATVGFEFQEAQSANLGFLGALSLGMIALSLLLGPIALRSQLD